MKLLLVLSEYGEATKGGIGAFYRNIIPTLEKAGCQIDVCITDLSHNAPSLTQPLNNVIPISPRLFDEALFQLKHLAPTPELRKMLACAFAAWETCDRGQGYDVVETTDWGLLYVPWVIQDVGPPVVVQFHGSNGQVSFHDPFEGNELEDLVTRTLEMALLGRADELQSGGRQNAREWSHLLCRPVHHIRPACTSKDVSIAPIPLNLEPDTFGLVVGRIQSWKGPEVLCQASALLADRAPKIVWVGRDHPFRRLDRSLSEHLRENYSSVWGKSIKPIGELSSSEAASLQAAARFVVVPSTWDTFNLTAAEAMGLGKVVICSDGAGAADLIEDGENGFRFPANDASALASLVNTVNHMSVAEREAIGQRARRTIRHELAADRICAQRFDRYTHLRATGRPARGSHPWLSSFFAAGAPGLPFSFLDKLPLKQLIRYTGRRAGRRLSTFR